MNRKEKPLYPDWDTTLKMIDSMAAHQGIAIALQTLLRYLADFKYLADSPQKHGLSEKEASTFMRGYNRALLKLKS